MMYSYKSKRDSVYAIAGNDDYVKFRAIDICMNEISPRIWHDVRGRRRTTIQSAINIAQYELKELL